MKANELMIGDWVEPRQSMIPTVYCKVEGIYPDGTVHLDKAEMLFTLDELTPVPLTPEILEKNGFHKEWDGDIILMVCDTIIVETGNNYKLYKDGKMYLRRVLSPLYYIHELQHALRLCGIEKTIEL